jgi:hypothetical protein
MNLTIFKPRFLHILRTYSLSTDSMIHLLLPAKLIWKCTTYENFTAISVYSITAESMHLRHKERLLIILLFVHDVKLRKRD